MGIGLKCIELCNATYQYIYNEEDESKTFRRPVASFTEGEIAHCEWLVRTGANCVFVSDPADPDKSSTQAFSRLPFRLA
jgi:hypothetical protein